jgi:hypothetical protein
MTSKYNMYGQAKMVDLSKYLEGQGYLALA